MRLLCVFLVGMLATWSGAEETNMGLASPAADTMDKDAAAHEMKPTIEESEKMDKEAAARSHEEDMGKPVETAVDPPAKTPDTTDMAKMTEPEHKEEAKPMLTTEQEPVNMKATIETDEKGAKSEATAANVIKSPAKTPEKDINIVKAAATDENLVKSPETTEVPVTKGNTTAPEVEELPFPKTPIESGEKVIKSPETSSPENVTNVPKTAKSVVETEEMGAVAKNTSAPETIKTNAPTTAPTKAPTTAPTTAPTKAPTDVPTPSPNTDATDAPTKPPKSVTLFAERTPEPTAVNVSMSLNATDASLNATNSTSATNVTNVSLNATNATIVSLGGSEAASLNATNGTEANTTAVDTTTFLNATNGTTVNTTLTNATANATLTNTTSNTTLTNVTANATLTNTTNTTTIKPKKSTEDEDEDATKKPKKITAIDEDDENATKKPKKVVDEDEDIVTKKPKKVVDEDGNEITKKSKKTISDHDDEDKVTKKPKKVIEDEDEDKVTKKPKKVVDEDGNEVTKKPKKLDDEDEDVVTKKPKKVFDEDGNEVTKKPKKVIDEDEDVVTKKPKKVVDEDGNEITKKPKKTISDHDDEDKVTKKPKKVIDEDDTDVTNKPKKLDEYGNEITKTPKKTISDHEVEDKVTKKPKKVIDEDGNEVTKKPKKVIDEDEDVVTKKPKKVVDEDGNEITKKPKKTISDHDDEDVFTKKPKKVIDEDGYEITKKPKRVTEDEDDVTNKPKVDDDDEKPTKKPKKTFNEDGDEITKTPKKVGDDEDYFTKKPKTTDTDDTTTKKPKKTFDEDGNEVTKKPKKIVDEDEEEVTKKPKATEDVDDVTMKPIGGSLRHGFTPRSSVGTDAPSSKTVKPKTDVPWSSTNRDRSGRGGHYGRGGGGGDSEATPKEYTFKVPDSTVKTNKVSEGSEPVVVTNWDLGRGSDETDEKVKPIVEASETAQPSKKTTQAPTGPSATGQPPKKDAAFTAPFTLNDYPTNSRFDMRYFLIPLLVLVFYAIGKVGPVVGVAFHTFATCGHDDKSGGGAYLSPPVKMWYVFCVILKYVWEVLDVIFKACAVQVMALFQYAKDATNEPNTAPQQSSHVVPTAPENLPQPDIEKGHSGMRSSSKPLKMEPMKKMKQPKTSKKQITKLGGASDIEKQPLVRQPSPAHRQTPPAAPTPVATPPAAPAAEGNAGWDDDWVSE